MKRITLLIVALLVPSVIYAVEAQLQFNEITDANTYKIHLFVDSQQNKINTWLRQDIPPVDGKHSISFHPPDDSKCHRYFVQPCTVQDTCADFSNWVDLKKENNVIIPCNESPSWPDPPPWSEAPLPVVIENLELNVTIQ